MVGPAPGGGNSGWSGLGAAGAGKEPPSSEPCSLRAGVGSCLAVRLFLSEDDFFVVCLAKHVGLIPKKSPCVPWGPFHM